VLGGAILGAIAGGYLYRQERARIQDEDFGVYFSIPLYVGGGAAIGALLGYVIGSLGDPPIASASSGDAQAKPLTVPPYSPRDERVVDHR
jgi:hypothetical protein